MDKALGRVIREDACGKLKAPPAAPGGCAVALRAHASARRAASPDCLHRRNHHGRHLAASLLTANPQEGFELAITLSRRGVKYTQPDTDVLKKLRGEYAESADGLTAASQVVAINFQTVAAANNYWRK